MLNPDITVQKIADDIARKVPMVTHAYMTTGSEDEKLRLRGEVNAFLGLMMSIDRDRAEMLKADWDAQTTSQNWTDEINPTGP